ncbi:helix-turn-helix domain-containing protein [Amycolatopsis sp. NPDC059090]|uniref:helix-turn-helix domain-containing protein n=1 Tax=unclassified Amycolatopsis TaxID=2618356 RepID=UPI00366C59F0
MGIRPTAQHCRCGARLAGDHRGSLCSACRDQRRNTLVSAPNVPVEFWHTDQVREAVDAWHMGRVIQAYRYHPWHGRPLSQGVVAGWFGLTQPQLSRIENGPAPQDLATLIQWAGVLRIPVDLLWFKVPTAGPDPEPVVDEGRDDVNRREVLRLLSLASSLLALPAADQLDLDRLEAAGSRPAKLDPGTLDEYGKVNERLWQAFAQSKSKRLAFPVVRSQLSVLNQALHEPQTQAGRRRLCQLAGDLFQLCGEIFFDSDQYPDAAQCYSLAANASKEAEAFDLWACALTRHAFLGVYERRFTDAAPLLNGAAFLAKRGDSGLATRPWVAAVQAQTYAGLGDLTACERALDAAEQVTHLSGPARTSGWLRFEGSRLAEERGRCYVELRRPELAEVALADALDRTVSARRRGSLLADLALVGVQRRDTDQLVMYGNAALDAARQTGSAGYVGRMLHNLRPQLKPFLADGHVRHLDQQIVQLKTVSVV